MDESNVNGPFNGKIGNAHAPCHVTEWYGHQKLHICNQRPQFACSLGLYNFYAATMTIKGVYMEHPLAKRFSTENFPSRQNRLKNGGFLE